MAEASSSDLPSGWLHSSVVALKEFIARNPQLVEIRGLADKDGTLLSAELLQLFIESDRFSGGGEIKKIFVSAENGSAVLTFKDAPVAKAMVDARYMYFHDRVLTVCRPTFHLWNVQAYAIKIQEFNLLRTVPPGVYLQELKKSLCDYFSSLKYRTELWPQVSEILFSEEQREALVVFEDFIDALHVMQMIGKDGLKINNVVIGRPSGPVEIPVAIERQLRQVSEPRGADQEPRQSLDSGTRSVVVQIKKRKMRKGLTINELQGIIQELGYSINVFDKTSGNAFVLEGPKNLITNLLESVRSTDASSISQCSSESENYEKTRKIPEGGGSQLAADRQNVTGTRHGIEETQRPLPVTPTDFLAEHRLAEKEATDRQNCALMQRSGRSTSPFDFLEEKLPNGTQLFVYTEDITKIKVDVIVNAANSEMKHSGGVAYAIANAAGAALVKEGFERVRDLGGGVPVTQNIVTTGGSLCRSVIHSVGPQATQHGLENCKDLVRDTVLNALKAFSMMQGTDSIAIPAISSGVYGVPIRMVALAMVDAVLMYDNARRDSPRKIHLVNILSEATHEIISVFRMKNTTETSDQTEEKNSVQNDEGSAEPVTVFPARNRRGAGTENQPMNCDEPNIFPARVRRGQQSEALVAKDRMETDESGASDAPANIGFFDRTANYNTEFLKSFRSPQNAVKSDGGDFGRGRSHENITMASDRSESPMYNSFTKEVHSWNSLERIRQQKEFSEAPPDGNAFKEMKQEGTKAAASNSVPSMSPTSPSDMGLESASPRAQSSSHDPELALTYVSVEIAKLRKLMEDRYEGHQPSSEAESKQQLEVGNLIQNLLKCSDESNVKEALRHIEEIKKYFNAEPASHREKLRNPQGVSVMSPGSPAAASEGGRRHDDADVLKILGKENEELQRLFIDQWKKIRLAECTDKERSQRMMIMEMLNNVSKFIQEGNVSGATSALVELKRKARESGDISPKTEEESFKKGNVSTCSSKEENLDKQNDRSKSQDRGMAINRNKPGDEPMDVDDGKDRRSDSNSSSTNSSFEVLNREGDPMSGYISEDEAESATSGATVKQRKGAKAMVEIGPDECAICLEVIKVEKKLDTCGHKFCRPCIDQSFKSCGPRCPLCSTLYGKMKGSQPRTGKMTVERSKTSLPGFSGCGSVVIKYYFPGGTQEAHHPNPGKQYTGTSRTAYLPDNVNGRKVMKLLRQAFDARLVFTVGQSATTGKSDTVIWNNIHHKTSMTGGPQNFGYPDPKYLDRVMEELAAFGIK